MDGEERLRLSGTFKKLPAQKVTGHWQNTIHDYFPDADGDGKNGDLKALTPDERKLLRRELAELGDSLAKVAKYKRDHN